MWARVAEDAVAPATQRWQWRQVGAQRYGAGFATGSCVLLVISLWWALVQLDHASGWPGLRWALPPGVAHAVVMVFGFLPLFIAGFAITAVPRWLQAAPPSVGPLVPALVLQGLGWALWIAGAHAATAVATAGLLCAAGGLGAVAWWLARLLLAGPSRERLHATLIAFALGAGVAALLATGVLVRSGRWGLVLALAHTSLWGVVAVVFVTAAHRLLPHLEGGNATAVRLFGPHWMLWLLLVAALLQAAAPLLQAAGLDGPLWRASRDQVGLLAGCCVLRACVAWPRLRPLRTRLVRALHLGVCWLGAALLAGALLDAASAALPIARLSLASSHAVAIGALTTLLVAMVTRVVCSHSGRAATLDRLTWSMVLLLQCVALLRIAASVGGRWSGTLLLLAATGWAVALGGWSLRLLSWLGLPPARLSPRPVPSLP